MPGSWQIHYGELTFNVKPMNFKHTGVFPEQAANWDWAMDKIKHADRPVSVLNLFAYTGAASCACAKAGASVCHVDAARGMVQWARENAASSGLADAPILANAVDGTLLIVNSANTKINAARSALKRLLAARARVVGALLAKYDVRTAGYSYGYGYHYQHDAYYAYGRKPKLTKG